MGASFTYRTTSRSPWSHQDLQLRVSEAPQVVRANSKTSSDELCTAAVVDAPMATERSRTIWRRSICVLSLASLLLLADASNGSTYAGNRFEGHFEIGFRGVESVAAGRAGCGSWWRSAARRLKLAMSGVTILALGANAANTQPLALVHLNRGSARQDATSCHQAPPHPRILHNRVTH